MLINLTPHLIRFFPPGCPDRIDPEMIHPLVVIYPSPEHQPARIGETSLGTVTQIPLAKGWPCSQLADGELTIPVEYVEYTSHGGLVHPLPEPQEGVWLIVALVVAIQQTYTGYNRSDLLVPYREVRNLSGTVIGCRQLARPV